MTSRVLKHLKHFCCPVCTAGIQSETFTGRTHCNGQQFESITFQCGSSIEWVPNFEREEIRKLCPKSSVSVAKETRRAEIGTAIWNALVPLNLTAEETEKVIRFLRYEWS